MDYETADRLHSKILEINKLLEESGNIVREGGTEEELLGYRNVIAPISASLLLDVMFPLYKQHPSLQLDEFKKTN